MVFELQVLARGEVRICLTPILAVGGGGLPSGAQCKWTELMTRACCGVWEPRGGKEAAACAEGEGKPWEGGGKGRKMKDKHF